MAGSPENASPWPGLAGEQKGVREGSDSGGSHWHHSAGDRECQTRANPLALGSHSMSLSSTEVESGMSMGQ